MVFETLAKAMISRIAEIKRAEIIPLLIEELRKLECDPPVDPKLLEKKGRKEANKK